MIFIWTGLALLLMFFTWCLCSAASFADDQMEAKYEEMRQEREGTYLVSGDHSRVKEDTHAG